MKNLFVFILTFLSLLVYGQTDSIQLIQPTGKFPVGTMIYEWTDETRNIEIASHQGDKRIIVVQLWYPARVDSNSIKAPYALLSKDYQKVYTNSYSRPPFSEEIENSNLILISPGRGTERFLYTTIVEELASHGFVVAAVDMPQIGYVIYQDGMEIKPSPKFKPPRGMMGGPYDKVDKFFEEPTEMGLKDMVIAYQKITDLNAADPNDRFVGKINLKSIGIFGHSLGGRIAGKFAVENKNIKAYIAMEGIPPGEIRYKGELNIPVAMLCSSGTWPYAKENYFSLIENRNSPVFMIELIDFGHNSVTDNPYIYPERFNYKIDPILGLELSRYIILKYFDTTFKNIDTFSNSLSKKKQIKFQEYK